jgi:hypothetical protein
MKNKMLLSLALGLVVGASPLMAATTIDVYITGSTAFRANVFTACQKLFTTGSSTPVYFGDSAHGGDANDNSGTASWCMSGTPISTLTNIVNSGKTLVIHGLFTGSIQGLETVEDKTLLTWATPVGTLVSGVNYTCTAYTTNSPTIGFSDASGTASPYLATGNYVEENVCVQPFVMCKAVGSGAAADALTNITNVSWEQMEYGIPTGYIPLSAWSNKAADTNTLIYLCQRTLDSGTRRCETAGDYYQYGDPVGIYIYDYTNNYWYTPTTLAATTYGAYPNGVVGPAGLANANLNWGYGYVGGGDIKNSLNKTGSSNAAIAYLSIGDSKGVFGAGFTNWNNVLSFNGLWPTAAGAGIHGNTGTNDFSPITLGYYPCWGLEVLQYSTRPDLISDQDISPTQLGTQHSPGSFMGVFNAQTVINGGSPVAGSIENEIELSKPTGATGIRLSDMLSNRASVGGLIAPY